MLEKILIGKKQMVLSAVSAVTLGITSVFLYPYVSTKVLFTILFIANSLVVAALVKNRLGLIPCARYLFLVSPGMLQFFFWHLSVGSVSVAILGNDYITTDIVNFVAVISTLGGASSTLGFLFKPIVIRFAKHPESPAVANMLFFILFAVFGLLYARSIGGSILEAGYSSDAGESTAKIGTLNVFFFYFFSLFFYYKYWNGIYTRNELVFYFVITLIIVLYIASRGVRQDSIGFFLAIIAIVWCRKRAEADKPIYWFCLFLFFISWIGSIFSGAIRENLSGENLSALTQNPLLYFTMILPTGYLVFNMNTASMTVGTLNVIPYKLIDAEYLYGKSFIDWLPRTLPDFLYPNRPIGPEFEMHYNNEWFGWGGIHEIAEVYWNFGFIGVLLIPMLFSYLIKSFGISFFRSRSFLTTIPIVWLIMMPRWIWYQIFALYKSTITMFILALVLSFIFSITFNTKQPKLK